jgi:hypothetical protein
LHGAARVGVELNEAEKLRQWLTGKWDQSYVAVRNIQQWGRGSMREKARIERLLNVLVDHGWLQEVANVKIHDKAADVDRIARVAWEIRRLAA